MVTQFLVTALKFWACTRKASQCDAGPHSDKIKINFYFVPHFGPVAQLARASVLHSEGRRFNSCRVHTLKKSCLRMIFSCVEGGVMFLLSLMQKQTSPGEKVWETFARLIGYFLLERVGGIENHSQLRRFPLYISTHSNSFIFLSTSGMMRPK